MKRVLSVITGLALVFGRVTFAQTAGTTATIVGFVYNAADNKPVEGALVVVTSPALQGEQTAVTDAEGEYAITNLPPGIYKIHVEFGDFLPYDQTDIPLPLLARLRVNLALTPSQVEMPPVKVSSAPVIDMGGAALGITVMGESLVSSLLGFGVATGANSTETAQLMAPGARSDQFGVSFAGSSSPENNTIIDGVPVGNTANGRTGLYLGFDFVQYEAVAAAGYAAEFGRASGGVTSIITKSGGNEFTGSVFSFVLPTGQLGQPVFRAAEAIADVSNYYGVLGAPIGVLQVGGELGGPIIKDKLWFYAGFMPTFFSIRNTRYLQPIVDNGSGEPALDSKGNIIVAPCYPGAPEYSSSAYQGPSWTDPKNPCHGIDTSKDFYNWASGYFMLGKLTYSLNDRNSFSVEAMGQPSTFTAEASGNGTPSLDANGRPTPLFSNPGTQYLVDARYNGKFLDRHLLVDATLAYFDTSSGISAPNQTVVDHLTGQAVTYNPLDTPAVEWVNPHSLTAFENDPTTMKVCADAAGATYVKCPVVNYSTGGLGGYSLQDQSRLYGLLAATGLFKLGGQHTLKLGGDYSLDTFSNFKVVTGGVGLEETPVLGSVGSPATYLAGSYGYQANPNDPNSAVLLPDYSDHSRSMTGAIFLQDSFEWARLITVYAGLRWEIEDLYGGNGQGGYATSPALSFNDNLAPRFRVTVDPTRSGRAKIYAHWGRYYEVIPLDIMDTHFPSTETVYDFRSPCALASPTVAGTPANCPVIANAGRFLGGSGNYAYNSSGSTPVAPGIQGQYNDIWGVGAAYELLPDMSLEVSYLDSTLGRVVEDMSMDDGNTLFIANPGQSGRSQVPVINALGQTSVATIDGRNVTSQMSTIGGGVPAQLPWPSPVRRYEGVTVELRKQASRNWELDAQYTYSRVWGNYEGLFDSTTGMLSPNSTSAWNISSLMQNKYGSLPLDSPNHVAFRGTYSYDLTSTVALQVAASYFWQSGAPINVLGAQETYGPSETFILPRGSSGRLPPFWDVDLRAGVEWVFHPPLKLNFRIDCFNVTDRQVKTSVDENYTYSPVYPIANGTMADLPSLRQVNGQPAVPNTNFLNATSYQSPRTFRFVLKVSF
jgi:hypothetical protein